VKFPKQKSSPLLVRCPMESHALSTDDQIRGQPRCQPQSRPDEVRPHAGAGGGPQRCSCHGGEPDRGGKTRPPGINGAQIGSGGRATTRPTSRIVGLNMVSARPQSHGSLQGIVRKLRRVRSTVEVPVGRARRRGIALRMSSSAFRSARIPAFHHSWRATFERHEAGADDVDLLHGKQMAIPPLHLRLADGEAVWPAVFNRDRTEQFAPD
jgi:hypothetical protein